MKPAFVNTEAGLVPEDWEYKELIYCVKFSNKSILAKNINIADYIGTDNMLPMLKGVKPYCGILSKYIVIKSYRPDDILISNIRPYLQKIWLSDRNGGCSNDVLVLRSINPNKYYPKYLYYYLATDTFFTYATLNSKGTKMPRGDKDMIGKYYVIFPKTKKEQKQIAEVLTDTDKLIASLEKTIAKQKAILQGTMDDLLTAKKRLPDFSKPWVEKKVREINKINVYQPQTISQRILKLGGFPVYGANGIIGYYDKYNHTTPQVMITCRGSNCGTINLSIGKCWITGNAMVVNVDKSPIDKHFLYYYLSNCNLTKLITGSGQPQIVRTSLLEYVLLLPSDKKEQTAIARVLIALEDEIKLLEMELDKYRKIRAGLMDDLLTGRKRTVSFK